MSTRAFAGAVTLLFLTTPVAWADLTAAELWADWQETYGRFGVEVTATERTSEDGLILDDLSVAMGFGAVDTRTRYGTVTLIERPDGTVAIEVPAQMAVTSVTTVEGEEMESNYTLVQEGLEITASEEEDLRVYAVAAESFGYRFEDLTSGEAAGPIPLTMTLTGLEMDYSVDRGGAVLGLGQTFAADELTVEADGTANLEPFSLRYTASDLSGTGTGTFAGPEGGLPIDGAAPSLAELGVDMEGTFSHEGSETLFAAETRGVALELTSVSQAGEILVAVTPDGLTETFTSSGTEAEVQMPQFPLPVSLSLEAFAAGFTLPVGVSDETKPFAVDLFLRGLEVDETIWSLFDPTGQLPRDPASLSVDLDGEAMMTSDIFGDPEALASGPPGEIEALTIGDVSLSIAGAALEATGDLTFPTGDLRAPVGGIDLILDGAFALVDRLVALGFIPADQAAFA
ncbi:MAG: hypothetical protein AAF264_00430, partial [Pseudomonadota bacterium]